MRRAIRLVRVYVERFLLSWLAGWSFVVTLVAEQVVAPLIGLAVWTAALPGQHLAPYYVALVVVQLATASYENHTLSNRIYGGELSDDLLRPHPVVFEPLGQNLALRLWHVAVGVPLVVGVAPLAGASFTPADVALAAPALVLAAALRFLYTFTLALAAFWTERAHGIVGFGGTLVFLLGGDAAPVRLLPGPLRPLGEALPFRAMHAFPAEIAAGGLTHSEVLLGYGWQAVWLALFALLAATVWQAGLRRYTAVGA